MNENTIRFAQEIYDARGKLISVHEKFPVDLGINSCKNEPPVKITRQIVADRITDYLHGKFSQAELVDWPSTR